MEREKGWTKGTKLGQESRREGRRHQSKEGRREGQRLVEHKEGHKGIWKKGKKKGHEEEKSLIMWHFWRMTSNSFEPLNSSLDSNAANRLKATDSSLDFVSHFKWKFQIRAS